MKISLFEKMALILKKIIRTFTRFCQTLIYRRELGQLKRDPGALGLALYPFIPSTRNNVNPAFPDDNTIAWMSAIVEVSIINSRPEKYYLITGAYGPNHATYPCCWVIEEADVFGFNSTDTSTRIVTYNHAQKYYLKKSGIQQLILRPKHYTYQDIEIHIQLDTDRIPRYPFNARTPDCSGFGYIIAPENYKKKLAKSGRKQSSLRIRGRGEHIIVATFNRDIDHEFELVMRPNGVNNLFNIRSTTVVSRTTGHRKTLVSTASDCVPPLRIISNEENVDTIPDDGIKIGYTGGNHASGGGSIGMPTAKMVSIKHYRDGVIVDASKPFGTAPSEYRIQWVNKLMAWNTKSIGRYVADQIVTAVIYEGTIAIWQEVVALENITVFADNGLQTFSNGFSSILFYNGEEKTSRINIIDAVNTHSGSFATTGSSCFAASLKGDAVSGIQTVWVDRHYEAGDGRYIGGTAGMFRVGGSSHGLAPKIYAGMITPALAQTFSAGQSYRWHMGITWGGLEGFDIDSAVVACINKMPSLIYAKLNDSPGTIKVPSGRLVKGHNVTYKLYRSNEPAGAYLLPISSIEQLTANVSQNQVSEDV